MPFNGTGTYAPAGADYPVVTLTVISSTHYNNVIADMSTALSNAVTRDGQSAWTANLPAGGFKLTGLAAGTARTDSARLGDAQDGLMNWVAAGGAVDVITATYTPAITALVDGQICFLRALGANATTTPTFSPNALTARTITRQGGTALQVGDIPAALAEFILRYNLANTRWELLNPAVALTAVAATSATTAVNGFSTGDVKLTIKTVADTGWVLMNDTTIGNAASGATGRANADTVSLFTLLYNNTVNGDCAVSGGRGANAAADYAANKTIALPKALGRALANYGTGAGLTARTMAQAFGEENHALSIAELAAHTHTTDIGIPGAGAFAGGAAAGTGAGAFLTGSTGSGTAHNTMQPTLFLNTMIKL